MSGLACTLAIAVALTGACSNHDASEHGAVPAVPPAPAPFRPQLGPRTDLGRFHPRRAIGLDDGSVVLGATLHDVAYDDHPLREGMSSEAAGFTVLGADGVVGRAFQIDGAQLLQLAKIDKRVVAVIERGGVEPGTVAVAVVELDVGGGRAGAETPLLTSAAAVSVEIAAVDSDTAIAMSEYDGHTTKSTVVRDDAGGHERWRRAFATDVTNIQDAGGGKLAIFERSEAKLVTRILDARGADVTAYALDKSDPGFVDDGDVEAAVRDGTDLVVVGEVGGSLAIAGTPIVRPPGIRRPFVLVTSPTAPPRFFDLDLSNSVVIAAGRWRGRTAMVLRNFTGNDGAQKLPRGTYLLGWAPEPARRALFPIYEYRYEDDNENNPVLPVSGAPIDVDAVAWTEHVAFLAGTCTTATCKLCGCVQQVTDGVTATTPTPARR